MTPLLGNKAGLSEESKGPALGQPAQNNCISYLSYPTGRTQICTSFLKERMENQCFSSSLIGKDPRVLMTNLILCNCSLREASLDSTL